MTLLFIIGVIAVALGALGLIFDGALDLPDSEWFSVTGLCAGGAMFCFVGGILQGFSAPTALWVLAGIIAALVVAVGTSWLVYKLRNVSGSDDTSTKALLGTSGNVVVPITPGAFGQINLTVNGETIQMNAVSEESINLNQSVQVIGIESSTCVRVENLR